MAAPLPTSSSLLVTIPDACDMLAIGRTHLYKLHRQGHFEFVRLGRATRVRVADVERLAGVSS